MSQTPQKLGQKMCKSPKNTATTTYHHHQQHQQHQIKTDKIDYENLNTNCTVVGSNNLNLVKKPPAQVMSPAYSNPSPNYPPSSPYSSPASLKSPSPSLKPPTPQPAFPMMQIIQNSHQLLARPIQQPQTAQGIIKLKPHLNILPKPSASPQPSPKPSVSPQIVIPTNQPIMPTAQPVLLNQMPLLTAPSVQFILRPQTAKMSPAPPQGLILQPGGQQLLQIQPPRSQPMVRVLTNGVQLAPATTTTAYVTTQQMGAAAPQPQQQQSPPQTVKKKVNNKTKLVKKKLDLANIMKLSGIGDEDDIQFESDASQSESEIQEKKIGNIQLSAAPVQHQAINTTPLVQVLNQNFPSGMISTNNANPTQTGIPSFSPFITTPNFTINNGLMVQRSGGYKLVVGEEGRFVLQHDPTLNQDMNAQLILQSIFGLNGGLVLQPSMDQQTVQQTVQTIQQQSVQTIQHQQTVQSQTIQTVQQQTMQPQLQQQTVQQTIQHQTVQSQPIMQPSMQLVQPQHLHSLQSQIQGQLQSLLQQQQQQQQNQAVQTQQHYHHQQQQPVLKVQPFQKTQPPVQTVHPQPQDPQHQQQQQQQQQQTSYVVNLTPDQLELLKRNGQVTVNGQTIFMQRPKQQQQQQTDDCNNKKLSPKVKPVKKVNKIQQKHFDEPPMIVKDVVKEKSSSSSLISALQSPPKSSSNNQTSSSKQAIVQPSIKEKSNNNKPIVNKMMNDSNGTNQDVEKLLGQLLEESPNINIITSNSPASNVGKNQRIHTIQLTPQKQEHLKNIQLQIQTLSANLTPGNSEIQAALKMLFAEQQKILATGKLLPPDKVYYHNNHLTIINPSSLNNVVAGSTTTTTTVTTATTTTATVVKNDMGAQTVQRGGGVADSNVNSAMTQSSHPVPRISVSVPAVPNEHSTSSSSVTSQLGVVSRVPQLASQQQQQQQQPIVVQQLIKQQSVVTLTPPQQQQQQQGHSIAKKAHLIEAQLNLDQSGAVKPDIHTPFRDKKDACIRLIRYHCMDQPVLSQKDLAKADEIFEMTAKHFIGKYAKMVDKYKYLLMKESMRQVQTSELMMLDRMYLSEERQSMMRLRQEAEEAAHLMEMQMAEVVASPQQQQQATTSAEDYDEWACIQRELGCLPPDECQQQRLIQSAMATSSPSMVMTTTTTTSAHAHLPPAKRTASSDSRLETLKRFRVDKHIKKSTMDCCSNVHNNSVSVQSVVSSSGINNTHHHHHHHHHNNSHIYGDEAMLSEENEETFSSAQNEDNEIENNSIDEQVQSAIDSILNLQQNTALDLDSILS